MKREDEDNERQRQKLNQTRHKCIWISTCAIDSQP